MLEFNWLLEHIEGLSALGVMLTFIGSGAVWGFRMLLARATRGMLSDIAEIKQVFKPTNPDGTPNGPALVETLQTMASAFKTTALNFDSGMKALQGDLTAIKVATQGNTARQRAVLAGSRTPMFESDKNGLCIWANPALLNLLERPFEEIRGRGWTIAIHKLDRADGVTEWDAAVREQRTYEAVYRVIGRNSGKVSRVKCSASPLFCDANAITGYLGRYETVVDEVPN